MKKYLRIEDLSGLVTLYEIKGEVKVVNCGEFKHIFLDLSQYGEDNGCTKIEKFHKEHLRFHQSCKISMHKGVLEKE